VNPTLQDAGFPHWPSRTTYVPSLPTQQFNVMKDYEAWERNQDYHFLRVGNGSASPLESSPTLLTAGSWVIGVSNTDDTVLSSVLSSRCAAPPGGGLTPTPTERSKTSSQHFPLLRERLVLQQETHTHSNQPTTPRTCPPTHP